ncbi:MAG TPA: glycoside hydrolase family 38 C-terminal domain-containing protein, partial [Bacteroidota bacterium]
YAVNPPGDPTRPGYDDSGWGVLKLDESIYPDSCWLRREVILPESFLGERVKGPVRFMVSLDDYGYLWVNGTEHGRFPWHGEFEIASSAKGGHRFVLVIKAVNTGGPLRLLRAAIETGAGKAHARALEDFSLSLQAGQKLLSFDTYQTNAARRYDPGTDKSLMDREEKRRLQALLQEQAALVDVDALARSDMKRFNASVDAVRALLKPVGEFAKRFTLYFDSNAHIDAAWLWRQGETIEVCNNTFTSVLDMMDARPDFTYTQSSAAYYEWMRTLYPKTFERIRNRIADGRWEVVGGMWVEPDCNLPAGESWMHHLLYSKRYFKKHAGVDVKIGWNPDSFGYNWNMPQFYLNAGMEAFITQKIGWNDRNVFPHRVFWWEGPDGSRLLSYFPFDYVDEVTSPFRLVDWMRQFEANTGYKKMLALFGVGDHGGGPTNEMLDRIDRLRNLDIFPKVEYGTAANYLAWLRSQDQSRVPVWKDELYLEYHRGTYTTQAAMKQFNRREEALLTNAEKVSALATLSGRGYRKDRLEDAWRIVLFNQFHDILPGSSIREVYLDATESHRKAEQIGVHELQSALEHIAGQINTSSIKQGTPLMVFNPLGWVRTDIVRFDLPFADSSAYSVTDDRGNDVPSQIVKMGTDERRIIFRADDVPSLGYKTYALVKKPAKAVRSSLAVNEGLLENEVFRVTVDPKTGWIAGVTDKRSGKAVLAGPANRLQILEDKPSAWDAWNIGLTGVEFPSRFTDLELTQQGPVMVAVRARRDYRKPGTEASYPTKDFPTSFFSQEIRLYGGMNRIEFKTDVDWWEEKTMLKVAFPLAVSDTSATYEIPYGSIRRTTQNRNSWDSARFEVSAQRWADLSQNDYGVSLLNRSKYGYDIKGSLMRLSLLRSPKWPDPTADRGKHSIEYALYPHEGRWENAGTVREGYAFNIPLIPVPTGIHKGTLSLSHSFVQVSQPNIVLALIKEAEDSKDWIVQWYESEGRETEVSLTFPREVKEASVSDFLEQRGASLSHTGKMIKHRTKAHSVVTVRLSF